VRTAPGECVKKALEYTGTCCKRYLPYAMIRLTLQSPSSLAVIPMQDWLGFGSSTRINKPSTVGGNNWCWRLNEKDINTGLAEKIAKITSTFGRERTEQRI